MNEKNRRREDVDPVLKTWRKIAPYFHVIWAIVVFTAIVTMKYSKVDAYDERIIVLETFKDTVVPKVDKIDQKLDDMIDYFGIHKRGEK